MSEEELKNIKLYSQREVNRKFPKYFVKVKKDIFFNKSTETENFLQKIRNLKSIKPENIKAFSLYQNDMSKSTFYSKMDNNSSINYKNNIKNSLSDIYNNNYSNNLRANSVNNDTILLSSLYNLPDYKQKTINYFLKKKNSMIINKKNKINDIENTSTLFHSKTNMDKKNTIFLTNDNFNSEINNSKCNSNNYNSTLKTNKYMLNNKTENFSNLTQFMKNKFYCDTEEKLNKKYHERNFIHDFSVKDKIIELHQIKEFWGGIFNYTNPIILTKRFQYITKLIEDRKKINEMKKIINNYNGESIKYRNFSEKNNLKMPKLYSVSDINHKRRMEMKKEKNLDKIKRNKTEAEMKNYFNNMF